MIACQTDVIGDEISVGHDVENNTSVDNDVTGAGDDRNDEDQRTYIDGGYGSRSLATHDDNGEDDGSANLEYNVD